MNAILTLQIREYDIIPAGDLAVGRFAEQCTEAGKKNASSCALFRPNQSAEALTERLYALREQVRFEPIVMGPNFATDIVDVTKFGEAWSTGLRVAIQYAPSVAGYFNSILENNYEEYSRFRLGLVSDGIINADNTQAIRCSDSMFRTGKLEDVKPRVQKLLEKGKLSGDTYTSGYLICTLWKIQAKERYEGNFEVKTKNPALIIGSPYDIRSPIAGAYATSNLLEGSVVLQHNGLGHCVMYSPGQCAIKAISDYFTNGALPKINTTGEQDFGVFEGKRIKDSFKSSLK